MNLFKDVSCGKNPPQEINVVVEIPKGSVNKYEIDEETGAIFLDRTLYSAQFFPFNYGFIPQTRSEDGDSLDIVLLTSPVFSGCVVKARPIGVILMEDEGGVDNKVVCVPVEKIEPRYKEVQDVKDLGEHQKKEIQEFFETYKNLEKDKWVKITGWEGKEKAMEIITKAIEKYKAE